MSSWHHLLKGDPVPWLFSSDRPWVRYNTLRHLLDQPENDPEVVQARAEILADPQVAALLEQVSGWPAYPITRHNDATHPIHMFGVLADFGLQVDDPGMDKIVEALLANQTAEGAFASLLKVPKAFGGSDEETLSWMLCDSPIVLQALVRFGMGNHPAVSKALAHLASLVRENGWPCTAAKDFGKFRGPGRKADPCPYANLIGTRALACAPGYADHPVLQAGVEMLLDHWENRAGRKIYLFGVGTTYRQLKYPFIWYDILHILDTLSLLPFTHQDPRFREMLGVLVENQDDHGRFKAGSVWMAYKGWEFAQKREPSPWLTFLALRVLKRAG